MTLRELMNLAVLTPPDTMRATLPIPNDLKTPYKLERLVVGPSHKSGTFDEKAADVPFVFRHQNRFYLTYVGYDGTGYQTGLASSRDLMNWRKEGVILPRDPKSKIVRYNAALTWILRENDVFGPGTLKKVNGRYLGAYFATPYSGYESGAGVIGLCWSRDLRHWEVEPPCLLPQDGAEWERAGLYKACIVEYRGLYHIFYNAKNRPKEWREQIGVATSRDLKTWVRNPANPILRNGPAGSYDERFASDPCVLKYKKEWSIFYYGLDRLFAGHGARPQVQGGAYRARSKRHGGLNLLPQAVDHRSSRDAVSLLLRCFAQIRPGDFRGRIAPVAKDCVEQGMVSCSKSGSQRDCRGCEAL